MRKSGFFPRLALVNLVRNGRFYGPYLLSCVVTAAMFYIIRFLCYNEGLRNVRGASYLMSFTSIGCFVAALLAAVILLYANSFVMKRRQRELGLYNVLGLEKRHVAWMCLWETLFCALITLAGGIVVGVLFSKVMLLLLLKTVRIPAQFGMEISLPGIVETAQLFGVLFLLTLLKNLWNLSRSNPVELLRSASAGEREPRTKWLLVILGVLSLGGGYVIAITTKNPIEALLMFFLAVGLVILGTYCLFAAGSIALLKRLRANPGFYYKTQHFTAVSGLLYRMKQNAVGLASICILSTMVLVTVSTTVAIYIGLEETLDNMFPYDVEFLQDPDRQTADSMEYLRQAEEAARASGPVSEARYYNRCSAYCSFWDGEISLNLAPNSDQVDVEIVALADYNRLAGTDFVLAPGEVLACTENLEDFPEDFTISAHFGEAGLSFRVRGAVTETIRHGATTLITSDEIQLFLVVADQDTLNQIAALAPKRVTRQFRVQMNLETPESNKMDQLEDILTRLKQAGSDIGYVSKQDQAVDFYAMYGGFLFLGIFLGFLFLLATVLIIYYKQISEGYEDQRRYLILRQVGMSQPEVNASIHSQILLVFFLPLGAAAVHILAAFPMLCKLLELFQLYNITLFALCTAGTLAVFCLIYALVFALTARTYSRLVNGKG